MQFRKKPVVIDAVQLTSENGHEVLAFCPDAVAHPKGVVIQALEGNMLADVGDWIIRGVKGEFYPCKPDIFAQTYDRAED